MFAEDVFGDNVKHVIEDNVKHVTKSRVEIYGTCGICN